MEANEAGKAGLVARARTLAADAAAAEVVDALSARGVDSILLKGPVLAEWLYPDGVRDYGDADLLVPPDKYGLAEEVLAELGYAQVAENVEMPRRGILHSCPWKRSSEQPSVDLHRTLFGTGVGPGTVWAEVSRDTGEMTVAGTTVTVLGLPALAVLIANHAAQHERESSKAPEDLRRAMQQAPLEIWQTAARLAERLNAGPTMSVGLSLVSGGTSLARRIGLVSPALARAATREGAYGGVAIGIERLWQEKVWRKRLSLLARELVPPRDFIYGWSPVARRSRWGMALVYLWRPLWLIGPPGPGLLTWLRHRESADP